MRENVARIRDIELLTGLRFLTKFDEHTSARSRTYLPTSLWQTKDIAYKWSDLPCDDNSQKTCPGYYNNFQSIYNYGNPLFTCIEFIAVMHFHVLLNI